MFEKKLLYVFGTIVRVKGRDSHEWLACFPNRSEALKFINSQPETDKLKHQRCKIFPMY